MEGLEKHSQGTWEKGKQKFHFKVEFDVFVWKPMLPQSVLAEHIYESEGP